MELHEDGARLPGREELVDALAGALDAGDRPVVIAVSLRDLDGLRAEDAGAADAAVAVAAERLARLVRSSDVLAFLGGGAYALAGPEMGAEAVVGLAERIRGAIAFPFEVGHATLSLVADVGWSSSGDVRPATAEELLVAAESDMAERRGA